MHVTRGFYKTHTHSHRNLHPWLQVWVSRGTGAGFPGKPQGCPCRILIGHLARIYQTQGRWNEAEKFGIEFMNMRKKLLGADHPDTLISMGNLAYTYKYQGKLNEAEKLNIQVMDIRKKLLTWSHQENMEKN